MEGEPLVEGVVGYEDTVHAAGRERAARGPRHHLPRRARPGEDAHHALARRTCSTNGCRSSPAARSTTTRTTRSRRTRACSIAERGDETPIEWVHRERRFGEKLATPDTSIADLIGEVDPIKVAEGRYLSDELTIHYGLVPRTNRGHLRDQRAARPRRAHPGRSAQRARGARRADPRLQDPPAARRRARRVGEPRGLHEPRPHHHAAQGPLRLADPHALPARDRARDGRSSTRRRAPLEAEGLHGDRARVHDRDRRRDQPARRAVRRTSTSVRVCRRGCRSRTTRRSSRTRPAARSPDGEREVVPRVSDLDALDVVDERQDRDRDARRRPRGPGARTHREGRGARGLPRPRAARAARPDRRVVRGRLDRAHRRGHPVGRVPRAARPSSTASARCSPTSRSASRPPASRRGIEFVLEGLHLTKRLNKDAVGARATYRARG